MPFIAELNAKSGLLLGGVKKHKSAPFIYRINAEHWLAQAINVNSRAGNAVGETAIKTAMVARFKCADFAGSAFDSAKPS